MGIDLCVWRARIGLHNSFKFTVPNLKKISFFNFIILLLCLLKILFKFNSSKIKIKSSCVIPPYIFLCINFWWLIQTLLRSGDIELNPGPLKFCHWNLNSISTDNFSRKTLIESFNTGSNYDIIAISETALHNSIDSELLKIPGYEIIRRDIPLNKSHGGVLVYYKDTLAVQERPEIEHNENQIVIEIIVNRKKVFFSVNYRRHHQDMIELTTYMENFKKH